MNHGYFQDRLSAYFDQSLTLEEMQAVKEHLTDCAECREQLDVLAKLERLIDSNAALGESDYWEKAARKIESQLTPPEKTEITDVRSSWFGLGWKLAAAAASVAALTFVALHEDEIQDLADKSGEVSKSMMAPSPTADSEYTNEVEFEMDEITDDMDFALESAGEPAGQRGKSSGMWKAPSPAMFPSTSEVSKELEGKAAAEEAWQDADDKRVTAEKSEPQTQPVTSVDELLESVAGVVTNAEGEIFIRGGRVGEVGYIVDSVPIGDPLGGLAEDTKEKEGVVDLGTIALERKRTDIGKTITVQGQRDIIDKFEVSYQASIIQEPQDTAGPPTGIDHWRAVRDSLQTYVATAMKVLTPPVYSAENGGVAGVKRKGATASTDSPPPPAADSTKPSTQTLLERYLEACYKIAELTDRESEYDSAVAVIEKHARSRYSPEQDLARHYLDMIDDLQE